MEIIVSCSPINLNSCDVVLGAGLGRPSEQRLPPHIQHGAEPAACGGDQPRVHAGEVLLPVPALQGSARCRGE